MTGAPAIAVIGLGHWGRNLVRNMHALGWLSIIYDTSAAAREAFSAIYPKVAMAQGLEQVWSDPSVIPVMIATPAATHGEPVGAALSASKHVFVEKPLCLDVLEAVRLKELAERGGRVLMFGHRLLDHPAFRALSRAVSAGALDALLTVAPRDISVNLPSASAVPGRVPPSI